MNKVFESLKEAIFRKGTKDQYTSIIYDIGEEWQHLGVTKNDKCRRLKVGNAYVLEYQAFNGSMERPHKHHNKESGIIIKGNVTYKTPYETVNLSEGQTFEISPGVWHQFFFNGHCSLILQYTPPFEHGWESKE